MHSRHTHGIAKGRMLIVAAMALAVGLLAGNAMAQTGTLTGTVTDDAGVPIDHALVVARGGMGGPGGGEHGPGHGGGGGGHHPPRYAYTDPSGAYVIPDLPAGTYHVTCGKPGYVRAEVDVEIAGGQTTVQDFALEPLAYGSVGGTVTDAVSNGPLEGAHVVLYVHRDPGMKGGGPGPGGGGMWLHAVTSVDGIYLIENVPVGTYDARAMMFGYVPSDPQTVDVEVGVQSVADFALEPLTFGSLEGTVTDAVTTDPIEGAFVVACRFGFDGPMPGEAMAKGMAMEKGGGGGWNVAMTDENGFYHFDQLPAGDWTVRAFKWGYLVGVAEVTIVADETTLQDFELTPR